MALCLGSGGLRDGSCLRGAAQRNLSRLCWLGRSASRHSHGRGDEVAEQRMRPVRPALQLRVELRAEHERVVAQLADLDQRAIRRGAAHAQARRFERVAVGVVELEAVAVPFADQVVAVGRGRERTRLRAGTGKRRGAWCRPC